jgi:hypothetical protein
VGSGTNVLPFPHSPQKQHLNEFADKSKMKIGDLLTEAAEKYIKLKGLHPCPFSKSSFITKRR